MRFLVDVGVGRVAEGWLSSAGHDVLPVREVNPDEEDENILELAVREKRIVVTMDKDFGELVYRASNHHSGVILLRMDGARGPEKAEAVRQIVETVGEELEGAFTVFHRGVVRVRKTS